MRARRRFGVAIRGLAGLALLLGGTGAGRAAPITWGPATDISGNTDVDTTSTLIAAFNVGDTGVGNTTVNGVTFQGLAVTGTGVTSGNFTFAGTGCNSTNSNGGSSSSPFSSLSAQYQNLLSCFTSASGSLSSKTIMAGLLIRELKRRGLAERILVVCPANLAFRGGAAPTR